MTKTNITTTEIKNLSTADLNRLQALIEATIANRQVMAETDHH